MGSGGAGSGSGSNFSRGNQNVTGNGIVGSSANFGDRGFSGRDFGNSGNGNLTRSGAPNFNMRNFDGGDRQFSTRNFNNGNAPSFANSSRAGAAKIGNFDNGAAGRNFSAFHNNFHNGNFHNNSFNGSFSHNWQSGQNFSHFHGNNFNHFNNFCHRGGWWGIPFCYPWTWGWWGGFGWGLGYNYYDYVPAYCYDTALVATVGYGNTIVADASAAPPVEAQPEAPQPGNAAVNADANLQGDAQLGGMFFSQAENAFQTGKYREAFRMANHAAIESPENPRAPELMSLSLFALGEYPAAAAQAHFALALGPPTDWASIFGYYGDADTYTKQLRALEKYSTDNPQSVEGHFLLGYHYLMTGYTKPALKELQDVVKLAPNDKLTAALVKKYGGEAEPAQPPAPPAPGANIQDNSTPDESVPPKIPPQLPKPTAQ